ncbi:MAG: P1 family peptidase [Candidatus Lokiarchaeota archaeon]|nr:P1 family peptidase [Candidatus Lokiarchaeota archaeon]
MVELRSLGWNCGFLPTGKTNSIIDVPGVSIGHYTIIEGKGKLTPSKGPIRTGVTIVLPHQENLFKHKVRASVHVANGFGKSTGIPQIQELGCIESPIAITGTLNVGLVYDALVEYMIQESPQIGITTGSISPVVAECNDSYLNDIQGRHVKTDHVFQAIRDAKCTTQVEEGNIGACTGFQVFQLKSGMGTASRVLDKNLVNSNKDFHIGTVVFPNFGIFEDFLFYGYRMAETLDEKKYFPKGRIKPKSSAKNVHGSIIVIIATDIPMESRQLNRLSKRGINGIIRTGSSISNTSGDFIFAFSTANQISMENREPIQTCDIVNDYSSLMEYAFRAVNEMIQEAIYKGMLAATTLVGRDDHTAIGLDINDLPIVIKPS